MFGVLQSSFSSYVPVIGKNTLFYSATSCFGTAKRREASKCISFWGAPSLRVCLSFTHPFSYGFDSVLTGDTVYVLLLDTNTNERVLWNASTGKGYLVTDKNCPVFDVALLVNENNVWANIQEHGSPNKIRWNLENRKDWSSFWADGQQRSEAVTIQTERLNYVSTSKKLVLFLEGEITSQLQVCKSISARTDLELLSLAVYTTMASEARYNEVQQDNWQKAEASSRTTGTEQPGSVRR